MEPIRIVVPFDPSRLSLNQRLHWRERKRRNDQAKLVARLAWNQAGQPKLDRRARVSIIVRRGRTIDADNALSGCKPVIDSLFCGRRWPSGAILPDDGPEWLELTIPRQEPGKAYRDRPEVEFVIEPLDERKERK